MSRSGTTTRDRGVPKAVAELSLALPYGDLDVLAAAFARHPGEIAAVVIEPSGATVPPPGYLQGLVDLCAEQGAVSVFDEVITGFRLARGGARERYGVIPDLSAFGKALGNGMPISALAGRAEVMDILEDVFFSGTHGGETLSLAAARATIDILRERDVHAHLWSMGAKLQRGLQDLIAAHGVGEWVSASGAAPLASWKTMSANCAPASAGSVVAVTVIVCVAAMSKPLRKTVSPIAPVPANANDGGSTVTSMPGGAFTLTAHDDGTGSTSRSVRVHVHGEGASQPSTSRRLARFSVLGSPP